MPRVVWNREVWTWCTRDTMLGAHERATHLVTRVKGPGDTVVLIHGLGRSPRSLWPVAWAARRRGLRVIPWGYRSRHATIEEHADTLDRELTALVTGVGAPVHFVTHSLGGLVLRAYLGRVALPNLGRIVMLAPPNQGSEVADRLRDWWLFRLVTGPAGQQLGAGAHGVASRLPCIAGELGIIAGDRNINPVFDQWIDGPSDGMVGVARTRLEGMTDHLVLHGGHTFLMWRPDVVRQVFAFLERGRFDVPA